MLALAIISTLFLGLTLFLIIAAAGTLQEDGGKKGIPTSVVIMVLGLSFVIITIWALYAN